MSFDPIALRDKLRTIITEHKSQLIQEKLEYRSRYVSFVFEHFYHSHNIDAAMRSIECCGFQDVHIINNIKKSDDTLTITKGADYWLTESHYKRPGVNNTQICLDLLKQNGYTLVGTTPNQKACTLSELPLETKVAIVFGNERLGISDYAIERVDGYVTIPMYGFTQSYNASVSTAIVAYELRKRLAGSTINWHLSQEEKLELELSWLNRIVCG
ncbi:MAG: RNA methyltransferase [Candidatus Babeliaceae bacterium]|nr:RNA methyltransferase [Candidatus Babeliaceae bacterium]